MPFITIQKATRTPGKKVAVRGWIHRKRGGGGIIFIVLRDVTGLIQVAIKKDAIDQKSWAEAEKSTIESSVELQGTVKEDARSPTGHELSASSFRNTEISEPFPITEYQSTELLLDKRHLWLRSQKMIAAMRARSKIFKYAREFLDKKGFYEITPPLITKAGGETGANLFQTDFFGTPAYLTESSQLYAEAMIFALEKVYTLAPSFRAEQSRTTKHLAEYWHLEPEMAYYDNKKSMALQERFISHIANRLADDEDILKAFAISRDSLTRIRPPFKKMTYEEALKILNDKGFQLKWGDDFGVEHERAITEGEEKPIFIYNWAKEIKPFYMPINPKDRRTVLCSDLQAPHGHGEIIGGSERIWKYEDLTERMQEVERVKGIKFDMKNYEWWMELRKYGSVPHAGFGMGMERVIKWMLNLDHIRDAIPFPRMSNRLEP